MNSEEKIISTIVSLDQKLRHLTSSCESFEVLLQLEHEALEARNLEKLESLIVQKQNLGSEIVEFSQQLIALGAEWPEPGQVENLSSFVTSLGEKRKLISALTNRKIADHNFLKLESALEDFLVVFKEIKPHVEKNRYIVAELLNQQLDFLRIWQETIDTSEDTYTSSGTTSRNKKCSVIQVKA